MARRFAVPFVGLIAAAALVACAGSRYAAGSAQPQSVQLPPLDNDLAITAILPPHTIGAGYPDDIGHVYSKKWHADVAGFTQTHYSQTLGFPPGTKITIKNISKNGISHTLNVIKKISGPPAGFPKNPKLLFSASGGHTLKVGYRSGILKPGASVTVTLAGGIYLIGCAYHYLSDNMRDVVVVTPRAKPGPTATPP